MSYSGKESYDNFPRNRFHKKIFKDNNALVRGVSEGGLLWS